MQRGGRLKRGLRRLIALVATGAAACVCAGTLSAASGSACGTASIHAKQARQEAVMLCLVNELRRHHGLRALRLSPALERAAQLKTAAIVRCRAFSHTPCGRSFLSTFRAVGYGVGSWAAGENLAWGARQRGAASHIFALLLGSRPHRANFLRRDWEDMGIALWRGRLFGYGSVALWAIDFGRR